MQFKNILSLHFLSHCYESFVAEEQNEKQNQVDSIYSIMRIFMPIKGFNHVMILRPVHNGHQFAYIFEYIILK